MSATITPSAGTIATHRTIRAPRGTTLSCKGCQQEAALRMLMDNLDPEVAEKREEDVGCVGGRTNLSRRYGGCAVVAPSVRKAELP